MSESCAFPRTSLTKTGTRGATPFIPKVSNREAWAVIWGRRGGGTGRDLEGVRCFQHGDDVLVLELCSGSGFVHLENHLHGVHTCLHVIGTLNRK